MNLVLHSFQGSGIWEESTRWFLPWILCKVIVKMPARGRVTSGLALSWEIDSGDGSRGWQRNHCGLLSRGPGACSMVCSIRLPGCPHHQGCLFPQNLKWRREQAAASHISESMKSCALLFSFPVLLTTAHSMWNGTGVRDGFFESIVEVLANEPAEVFYNSNQTSSVLHCVKIVYVLPLATLQGCVFLRPCTPSLLLYHFKFLARCFSMSITFAENLEPHPVL